MQQKSISEQNPSVLRQHNFFTQALHAIVQEHMLVEGRRGESTAQKH